MFGTLAKIDALALNTYREAVRARILHGLAALALATAIYSIAIGEFALGNAARVVSDLGGASISLYAVVVAIVVGATSLYRELEQKTIFPILARPIPRAAYLVGKYLGILLTLAVFVALDAATALLILAYHGGRSPALLIAVAVGLGASAVVLAWKSPRWRTYVPIPWGIAALAIGAWLSSGVPDERRLVLAMCALSLLEVMIVTAITMVFSSFSSPFLTAVFTFGLFIVGRDAGTLAKLPERVFGPFAPFFAGVARVVPNLQVYVPPRPLLTGEAPGASLGQYLGLAAVQSIAWSVGLLVAAHWIFRRRDIL